MITATITPNGNLKLTADNEGRAALKDAYSRNGYHGAEGEVAEALHESYDFVLPEYVCGALTDAPILIDSDHVFTSDSGQTVLDVTKPVYWFPNYMIEDPFETLKNTGRVIFTTSDRETVDEPKPVPPTTEHLKSFLPGGANEGRPVWFGDDCFPDASYDDVLKAWPELARSDYELESWDYGMYFWKEGERYGPYNAGADGFIAMEKAGAILTEAAAPDENGELFEDDGQPSELTEWLDYDQDC